MKTNRIIGSLLALALGDTFGAPHEGGILERTLWAIIGNRIDGPADTAPALQKF